MEGTIIFDAFSMSTMAIHKEAVLGPDIGRTVKTEKLPTLFR